MSFAIRCRNWEDFRAVSREAAYVLYEFSANDRSIRIWATKLGSIYLYEEALPYPRAAEVRKEQSGWVAQPAAPQAKFEVGGRKFSMMSKQAIKKQLSFGLSYSVTPKLLKDGEKWVVEFDYGTNPEEAKDVLSRELDVARAAVLEGSIAGLR